MTVTDKQIAALKYLITRARLHPLDFVLVTSLAKQLVWRLIEASQGLTKPIFVSLNETDGQFSPDEISQLGRAVDSLQSSNGDTHLGALMKLMGVEFRFALHYGAFADDGTFDTSGQNPEHDGHHDAPMRYTFWLGTHDTVPMPGAEEVRVTRAELEAIDLSKPGLYPSLEQ